MLKLALVWQLVVVAVGLQWHRDFLQIIATHQTTDNYELSQVREEQQAFQPLLLTPELPIPVSMFIRWWHLNWRCVLQGSIKTKTFFL